jgi:hypothetical protein
VILPDVMKSDKEEIRNVMKRIRGRICQAHTEAFHCSWLVKGNEMLPFVLRSQLRRMFNCIQLKLCRTALPLTLFILPSNSELNTTVSRVQNCTII